VKQAIDVNQLQPGLYVSELDRPWLETPFLFQGFMIQSWNEIEELKQYCEQVYIETDASYGPGYLRKQSHNNDPRFATRQLNIKPSQINQGRPDTHTFADEVETARSVYRHSHEYVTTLLSDVRDDRAIDIHNAKAFVEPVVDSIVRNSSAMTWLSQLKSRDEYTVFHSINVCILAVVLGKRLGLPDLSLRELGLGALLHDIGKMRVPLDILNKPRPLSLNELAIMRRHPVEGYQLLRDKPGVTPGILDIVALHHERWDGTGYPRGLKGDQINRFPAIVAVVDVYDAITTDRVYHHAISPHEALKRMYDNEIGSFSGEILQAFIQCLSIYPIGSLVELDSGEVGIVVGINAEDHFHPTLLLATDATKQPLPQPSLYNLATAHNAGQPTRIKTILESQAYGIDVQKILRQETGL
jgi:putative nucleotidyltransferase with HDIG domain